MRRLFLIFIGLTAAAVAATPRPAPPIAIEEIASPARPGASGFSLVTGPDGTAWLSWMEPDASAKGATALRIAAFDASQQKWTAPHTVARGADWFVNFADFPALTAGPDGRLTAAWFVNNPPAANTAAVHDHHGPGYQAYYSQSADRGVSWNAPQRLTKETASVEFVALATLADGRVLAAWLDGRGRQAGGKTQQLFARILGTDAPDTLVDPSVCDCCQTTLTAFPDGSALLAYRGRTEEEQRDIRTTRFRGGRWSEPRLISADDWRINACPVNGPQLSSDGGRVGAAWFTAADNQPRVLASVSPDAGGRFLMPLRIDRGHPLGRVDQVILHDGALLATWVENDGALWLRRVTPDFTADEPVQLAAPSTGRVKGFPRSVLVRDYAGGKTTAQFLVAFARDGSPGSNHTLLVTVPEGELLETQKNCDCAPTAEQLQGFAIRGTIGRQAPEAGRLQLQHFEVPGILDEGTSDFKVAPALLPGLPAGRQILGRIERRGADWWLFDVKLLSSAR